MKITDAMRAAHIMVCGDAGTGKVMRVRRLAEEVLERTRAELGKPVDERDETIARRRIVYFSNNDRGFGLSSGYDVTRFGVSTHNLIMAAADGAHFAKAVLESRQSIAFDFGEMSPEDVSAFLSGFIGVVNKSKKVDFDIFFECLDDLIGRKRHRDRSTANTFRSLLLRGPAANGGNGVRVTVGATSPDEVPIETSRHSLTILATRTSANENVKALSACVGGNPTLYQCTINVSASIRATHDEHHWLWAMSECAIAPFMPYLCPMTPLVTDAGSGDEFTVETTDAERDIIARVVELRAEAAPEKSDPEARRRGGKTRSDVANPTAYARHTTQRIINGTGLSYASHRAAIARLEMKVRADIDIAVHTRRAAADIVARMADDRYTVPASWMFNLATADFATSPGLLGLAYVEARDSNPEAADAFFANLKAQGCDTSALRQELTTIDAPALSQQRLDAVRSAFAAYIDGDSPKPTAANDDVAIAQAI